MQEILCFPPVNEVIMNHLNVVDKIKLAVALNDYTDVQHRIQMTTAPRYTKEKGKYTDNVLSFLKKLETRAEFLLNNFLDLDNVRVIATLPIESIESLFGLGDKKYDNTKPFVGDENSTIRIYVDFVMKPGFKFNDRDHRQQRLNYLLNTFMDEFPGFLIGTLSLTKEIDLNYNDFAPTRQELMRSSMPSSAVLYKIFTSRCVSTKEPIKWAVITTENDLLLDESFYDEPSNYNGMEEERFRATEEEDISQELIDELPTNPFSFNDEKYVDVDIDSLLKTEFVPPPMNKEDVVVIDPRRIPSKYERVVSNFCAKRELTDRSKPWWASIFYEPIFLYRYPPVRPFTNLPKETAQLLGFSMRYFLNRNLMYPSFSPDKKRVLLATNVRYITHAFSCETQLRTCDGEILRCCEFNIRHFLNSCIKQFEEWYDGDSKKTHYRMALSVYRSLYHVFSCHAVINPLSPESIVATAKRRASSPVSSVPNKRTKYES